MNKILTIFMALASLIAVFSVGLVSAAVSPGVAFHEPGSPFVSCGVGDASTQPNGFLTSGFAHAATVYAGSPGTPSLANGNARAVAQYDVACFQLTTP